MILFKDEDESARFTVFMNDLFLSGQNILVDSLVYFKRAMMSSLIMYHKEFSIIDCIISRSVLQTGLKYRFDNNRIFEIGECIRADWVQRNNKNLTTVDEATTGAFFRSLETIILNQNNQIELQSKQFIAQQVQIDYLKDALLRVSKKPSPSKAAVKRSVIQDGQVFSQSKKSKSEGHKRDGNIPTVSSGHVLQVDSTKKSVQDIYRHYLLYGDQNILYSDKRIRDKAGKVIEQMILLGREDFGDEVRAISELGDEITAHSKKLELAQDLSAKVIVLFQKDIGKACGLASNKTKKMTLSIGALYALISDLRKSNSSWSIRSSLGQKKY